MYYKATANKVYIYIYIYIYIYCHPQTDCFVVSQLFHVASWDRNPLNFTLDLVSDRSVNKRTRWLRYYKVLCSSSSSVRLFTFYTLPDTRVLNSFEEFCITRACSRKFLCKSAQPPWGSVCIYIYIYIYI